MDLENEKDIDSEALQAQIDLSMSFAQDMVSSWIKPHKLPKNSRRGELELELKEYMKKPPRLGVGAAIPTDNQSMTRETARLKGRLAGSKRLREEDEQSGKTKSTSNGDDQGESRAGAIQKKQRVDPFAGTHGKKKKKQKESGSQKVDSTPTPQTIGTTESQKPKATPPSDSASLKSVKKTPEPPSTNEVTSPSTPAKHSASQSNGKTNGSDTPSHKVPSLAAASPQEKSAADTLLSPSAFKGQTKSIPTELLKKPLLNLTGPPPESDSDEAPDASAASPKKKRKRRKKKKNVTGSSDPQGSAPTPT